MAVRMAAPEHLSRRERVSVFNDHLAISQSGSSTRESPAGNVRGRIRGAVSPAVDLASLDSCDRISWPAQVQRPLTASAPSTRSLRHLSAYDLTITAALGQSLVRLGGRIEERRDR